MPIYKGTLKTGAAYKGSTSLSRIYKGAYLVFEAFKTLIAEGVPPLTLLNCAAEIMLGYRVYGNSIQDGTPTPDTPIEIESVGDKTKNLWNSTLRVGCMKFADGQYLNYSGYVCNTTPIPVEAGGTYTISANNYNDPDQTSSGFVFYNNGSFVSSLITTSLTVTIPSGVNQLYYNFRKQSDPSSLDPSDITNVQLEKGSSATSYEPYGYRIPVKVSGLNLWDEQWELGGLNSSTGIAVASDYSIISKNFISVSPNETYFIRSSGNERIDIYQYDSTKTFIQRNTRVENKSLTSKNNTYYIKLYLVGSPESPITTYNNDICINKSNELINGTYEPYYEPRTTNIYLDEPLRKIGNDDAVRLPNGYTQLKYIATSSSDTVNAYIDTGLYANPNLRINTEVEFIDTKGQASIFRSGADFWAGVYLDSRLRFAYTYRDDTGNYTATSITAENGTRYNIDFDGKQKTLKINDNTITISGSPATKTSTKTLPLLGRVGGDGASVYSDFYGKLYHAKIYDNDILARDFIPCKNSSNVVGLYDLVNGVFYPSANTVDFVAGPMVYADYIDFETQKVVRNVEVIDDTGTLPIEQSLQPLVPPVEQSVTLPDILLNKGTNIISIGTSVQPSNMWIKYKSK